MKRLLTVICFLLPGVVHAQVMPTNEWVNFWSDHSPVDFQPMPVGSLVRAYDPQGILCGEFAATTPGSYGLMPVYRDDPTTPGVDEGAEPGDPISFTIYGVPATPFGPNVPVWTSNGDIKRVNLAVGDADLDIQPGSCPNTFSMVHFGPQPGGHRKERRRFPVAVVGTPILDVSRIDAGSVTLEGVSPTNTKLKDVTALPGPPGSGSDDDDSDDDGGGTSLCPCPAVEDDDDDGDGTIDFLAFFRWSDIADAIDPGSPGEERFLTLRGALLDGTPFEASDCVCFVRRQDDDDVALPPVDGPVLGEVYPNPFNPVTRIRYELPRSSFVALAVYDVRGRRVHTLVSSFKTAGTHVVAWDAVNVPSGVYLARLEADGFATVRKLILLK